MLSSPAVLLAPLYVDGKVGLGVCIGIVAFRAGGIGVCTKGICHLIREIEARDHTLGDLNGLAYFLTGAGIRDNGDLAQVFCLVPVTQKLLQLFGSFLVIVKLCDHTEDGSIPIGIFNLDGKDFTTSYESKIDAVTPAKVKAVLAPLSNTSRVEYIIER